jgi:hypothetical protein
MKQLSKKSLTLPAFRASLDNAEGKQQLTSICLLDCVVFGKGFIKAKIENFIN